MLHLTTLQSLKSSTTLQICKSLGLTRLRTASCSSI